MKHSTICILSLLTSVSFLGCNDDHSSLVSEPEMMVADKADNGIERDKVNISTEDASYVAQMFSYNNSQSRSVSNFMVKNIVPIKNDAGEIAMYAVNFVDGYVIVSATKTSVPIQAFCEQGEFKLDDEPFGRDIIINDLVNDISLSNHKAVDPAIKAQWSAYENKKGEDSQAQKSKATDPELLNARGELVGQLVSEGYYVTLTTEEEWEESLPPVAQKRFKEYIECEAHSMLEEIGQDAFQAGIVAQKSVTFDYRTGPYVTTKWNQKFPYNASDPQKRVLGCVTVAVAQLMKYYSFPNTINWSEMPNTLTTNNCTTLTDFLYQLRKDIKVEDNSGTATMENAVSALYRYGYTCHIASQNEGISGNVICTKGFDRKRGEGHAWLMDGTIDNDGSYTEYLLYFPHPDYWPDYNYQVVDSYKNYGLRLSYTHMNWGWGGRHDGWFRDGIPYIVKADDEGDLDLTSFRETIIVDYPKK